MGIERESQGIDQALDKDPKTLEREEKISPHRLKTSRWRLKISPKGLPEQSIETEKQSKGNRQSIAMVRKLVEGV